LSLHSSPIYQSDEGLVWLRGNMAKIVSKIIDEEGNPVNKAIILIPETNQTAETNPEGIFSIPVPKKHEIHLEIYKEGYAPYKSSYFMIRKNEFIPTKFTIMKTIQESITVTATASGKKLIDSPIKTYALTKENIMKHKPVNLSEALNFTTGLIVEDNCQNCNFSQVRLNGLEGKYTQILIDGLPVVSSLASVYGLDQIPTEMIDSIEIVKGGTSSLYGGNAIGGVVNIRTIEPFKNESVFRVQNESVKGKIFLKTGITSHYLSDNENTSASFFASYFKRQPVDVNNDGFSNIGKLNDISFGGNLFRDFSSINGKLKLSFSQLHENRRGGNNFENPPHEADIAEMAKTNRTDANLFWEQFLGNDVLKIALSYTHHERDSYYGAEKDLDAYGYTENPVLMGVIHFFHQMGSHYITIGASYKKEKINDRAPGYNRFIDDKYENYGFMVQDDFNINNFLELLGGFRIDKHSKVDDLIISPRVSIKLDFTDDFQSRTTFSTGFRAPQVFDEDFHIAMVGGEGFIIKNDPLLKEEKSYSINHSFDYYKSTKDIAFQINLGFFYNNLDNVFVLEEREIKSENSRVFFRKNGKVLNVYGIEFDFGFKKASLFQFDIGWTYQKSKFDEPEPEFGSKTPFKTPKHYGFARLIIDAIKNFDIDISFKYKGPMKMPHYAGYIENDRLEDTAGYYIINASVTRNIKLDSNNNMEIFAKAYNLTDEFQDDIDRGIYRDAGYRYGPVKPRSFIFGIRYLF